MATKSLSPQDRELKLDPSKGFVQQFIALHNKVMSHFSDEERKKTLAFTPAPEQATIQHTVQMLTMES
ncbi:MAG: hypothetical protein COB62_01180 [Piscirickettsiaceae bacterium]|nr:MAG: hypothetical protein COB62_01180 [Piscirickettsiaceae bacterium]